MSLAEKIADRAARAPQPIIQAVDPTSIVRQAQGANQALRQQQLGAQYNRANSEYAARLNNRLAERLQKSASDRAIQRDAFNKSVDLAAQGYGNPLKGMTESQAQVYGQASEKGAVAKQTREGQGRYAGELYNRIQSYRPSLQQEQITSVMTDSLAPPDKVTAWLESGGMKDLKKDKSWGPIMQIGAADGGSAEGDPMPTVGSPGWKVVQRKYIDALGMGQELDNAVLGQMKDAEAQYMTDLNQFNLLNKAGANWFPYIDMPTYGYPAEGEVVNKSAPKGEVDTPTPPPEGDNPISTAAGIAGRGLGTYAGYKGLTSPSAKTGSYLYGRHMERELERATRRLEVAQRGVDSARQNLKGTPKSRPTLPGSVNTGVVQGDNFTFMGNENVGRAGEMGRGSIKAPNPAYAEAQRKLTDVANPAFTEAQKNLSSISKAQRDLLSANGFAKDIKQMDDKALNQFLGQMIEEGKIKKVPKSAKELSKRLSKGVLGSIWKKALAAIAGPTVVGSAGTPAGSVAGFIFGLGMAAWTAYDLYGISKDLMGE